MVTKRATTRTPPPPSPKPTPTKPKPKTKKEKEIEEQRQKSIEFARKNLAKVHSITGDVETEVFDAEGKKIKIKSGRFSKSKKKGAISINGVETNVRGFTEEQRTEAIDKLIDRAAVARATTARTLKAQAQIRAKAERKRAITPSKVKDFKFTRGKEQFKKLEKEISKFKSLPKPTKKQVEQVAKASSGWLKRASKSLLNRAVKGMEDFVSESVQASKFIADDPKNAFLAAGGNLAKFYKDVNNVVLKPLPDKVEQFIKDKSPFRHLAINPLTNSKKVDEAVKDWQKKGKELEHVKGGLSIASLFIPASKISIAGKGAKFFNVKKSGKAFKIVATKKAKLGVGAKKLFSTPANALIGWLALDGAEKIYEPDTRKKLKEDVKWLINNPQEAGKKLYEARKEDALTTLSYGALALKTAGVTVPEGSTKKAVDNNKKIVKNIKYIRDNPDEIGKEYGLGIVAGLFMAKLPKAKKKRVNKRFYDNLDNETKKNFSFDNKSGKLVDLKTGRKLDATDMSSFLKAKQRLDKLDDLVEFLAKQVDRDDLDDILDDIDDLDLDIDDLDFDERDDRDDDDDDDDREDRDDDDDEDDDDDDDDRDDEDDDDDREDDDRDDSEDEDDEDDEEDDDEDKDEEEEQTEKEKREEEEKKRKAIREEMLSKSRFARKNGRFKSLRQIYGKPSKRTYREKAIYTGMEVRRPTITVAKGGFTIPGDKAQVKTHKRRIPSTFGGKALRRNQKVLKKHGFL